MCKWFANAPTTTLRNKERVEAGKEIRRIFKSCLIKGRASGKYRWKQLHGGRTLEREDYTKLFIHAKTYNANNHMYWTM